MTDTPTPPAMTPEQRARLIAKLQNQAEDIGIKHGRVEAAACMEAEAAEYLEADGVTIATLTAECDAAQTDLGIIIMSLPHGQNMRINGPVIGVKMLRKKYDAAQAEIARLTAENFALSAWQCVFHDGRTGLVNDEHGNQYCAMQQKGAAT